MKYYFAPLESITGYPLRNAHRALFPETDAYFSPFISSNEEGHYTGRIERDCAVENNNSLVLIPQIMGNRPDFVHATMEYLEGLGYQECNLNLGCPSGTVVAKGKGSGMLRNPMVAEEFENEGLHKDKNRFKYRRRMGRAFCGIQSFSFFGNHRSSQNPKAVLFRPSEFTLFSKYL